MKMKNFFRLTSRLVATVLLGLMAQSSFASHFQGGDLTYQCVAPGVYVVNTKIYRDCTGATAPTSITLNINSPGCNAGRTFTVQRTGNPTIGNPYCASIPKTCSTVRANYEEVVFSTTITFTAAELTCPTWLFSTNNSARPEIENLVNPQGNIYAEAMVNLTAGINNNSPEFNPLNVPIPFVCVGQDTRYSLNAAEADGDSLSYELAAPLSAAGVPYTYAPISNGGQQGPFLVNPNPPAPYCNTCTPPRPQLGYFVGTPITTFSPTYPLPSFNGNWNQIDPATGIPRATVPLTPYFELDSLNGQLRFRPAVHSNTPPVQGDNKYAVVVKITEWRKIGGVVVKVGHIRRDILFIVEDCGTNTLPNSNANPAPPKFNAEFKNDTVFNVQTCNTTPINLNFIDPDTADELTVTFDMTAVNAVPNSTFKIAGNGTNHVTAQIYITPDTTLAGNDYYIPVRIEDNACPIKGINNLIYKIHVVKRNLGFVKNGEVQTICKGESTELEVDVNRPDSLMTPPSKNLLPTTYSYEWTLAPGLNAGDLNKKIVTVNPIVTTRYKVKIISTMSTCFDTTSVLVKVQELPEIKDIQVLYAQGTTEVRYGSIVQLLPVMGGDTAGYTYSWSSGESLFHNAANFENDVAFDTISYSPFAGPKKTQDYFLTVTTADGMCSSTRKVTVNVGAPFLPNIITPNNDGLNDKFEFKALLPNTKVQIFNRWGVLVKEYSNYNNEFDGKGVSDGTYYYFMKEAGGKTYKGFFDIVH
jgi:gliding motility-associated-like protein